MPGTLRLPGSITAAAGLPPRRRRGRADGQHLAEHAADPPARARFLAGAGRDLLLRRPAKNPDPKDFIDLDQSTNASPCSRPATTPPPGRSPGSSPAPTSAACYAGSTAMTRPSPTPWQPDVHPTNLRASSLSACSQRASLSVSGSVLGPVLQRSGWWPADQPVAGGQQSDHNVSLRAPATSSSLVVTVTV